MTSLDGINGRSIQTLLSGENDSKQSDEFQAYLSGPWRTYPDYRGCFDAQGFLQRRKRLLQLALLFPVFNQAHTRGHNRPFYRYGGHIELIGFKEYYRMPGDMITFRLYFRALFGSFFLKGFLE